MMLKEILKKGSNMLAGFMLGMLVIGFAGIVTANSTFSGPNNKPPNGFISPTFDGLNVNGRLNVVGNDGVFVEQALTAGRITTNDITGTDYNGQQTVRFNSAVVDMRGVTDIKLGSNSSSYSLDIDSHMTARSIGYMYPLTSTRSMSNTSANRLHSASVTCGSNTYLVSCTGMIPNDYGSDYNFIGSNSAGNTCQAFARQAENFAGNATLNVKATCWNPSNPNRNY